MTNNVITSEVAGMVINGMWGTSASVPLLIQPTGVDSLEPSYTCASSAAQFSAIQSTADPAWAAHFDATTGLYATLDGISGVSPSDSGFHKSFDHCKHKSSPVPISHLLCFRMHHFRPIARGTNTG